MIMNGVEHFYMTEYCCEKFQEYYEEERIEIDEDDNYEPNGKYSVSCCCGSTKHGGIRVLREMEYCPFCGEKLE